MLWIQRTGEKICSYWNKRFNFYSTYEKGKEECFALKKMLKLWNVNDYNPIHLRILLQFNKTMMFSEKIFWFISGSYPGYPSAGGPAPFGGLGAMPQHLTRPSVPHYGPPPPLSSLTSPHYPGKPPLDRERERREREDREIREREDRERRDREDRERREREERDRLQRNRDHEMRLGRDGSSFKVSLILSFFKLNFFPKRGMESTWKFKIKITWKLWKFYSCLKHSFNIDFLFIYSWTLEIENFTLLKKFSKL